MVKIWLGLYDSLSPDKIEVRELYRQMLDGWNKRSADAFTVPFAEDGESISTCYKFAI